MEFRLKIMSRKPKKELTLCIYCKNRVREIEPHLERCPKRKQFEIELNRRRAELKEQAEFEHLKRLKRLGNYLRTPTPSRSSSKSKAHSYSSWKTLIGGGAVETNKRHH